MKHGVSFALVAWMLLVVGLTFFAGPLTIIPTLLIPVMTDGVLLNIAAPFADRIVRIEDGKIIGEERASDRKDESDADPKSNGAERNGKQRKS